MQTQATNLKRREVAFSSKNRSKRENIETKWGLCFGLDRDLQHGFSRAESDHAMSLVLAQMLEADRVKYS